MTSPRHLITGITTIVIITRRLPRRPKTTVQMDLILGNTPGTLINRAALSLRAV